MSNNKCLGCGILKQIDRENDLGYVLNLDHDLCLDCFKLKNYGIVKSHVHPERLPEINSNSAVLIIQSIMQLDLLFMQPITRIQPNAKYIYIINQVDLLPRDTNLDYIHDKIVASAKMNRLPHYDIIFMSAINKNDTNNLLNYVLDLKEKEVYLFGIQNSGKSTIFKALTGNESVLSINKAGLTQEVITAKIKNKTIYDMPGTYFGGYLHDFLDYEQYKNLIPSKTIKPRIFQMHKKQTIIIEDFISVLNSNIDNTFVFYINNQTKTNKYNEKNIDKYLNENYSYVTKSFKILEGKQQITFGDLGFLLVTGPTVLTIKTPKELHVSLMEAYLR